MIQVAVGIIVSNDSSKGTQILLCQRKKASRYGLKWEFPGGKLNNGESPDECMRRELLEELGIIVERFKPYHQELSVYPDGKSYEVEFYLVTKFSGTPKNLAFEQVQWIPIKQLSSFDILEGNVTVVQKLSNEFT